MVATCRISAPKMCIDIGILHININTEQYLSDMSAISLISVVIRVKQSAKEINFEGVGCKLYLLVILKTKINILENKIQNSLSNMALPSV